MTDSIWDDSRITSYVLGELPEEERAAFEREMGDNASLKSAVDEARSVTDRVGSFFDNEAAQQLDESHRTQILQGAASAENLLSASNEESQVSLAEKNLTAPSWGLPAIATAVAASLVLLIGVAPWLRQQDVVTAVASDNEARNATAIAAVTEETPAAEAMEGVDKSSSSIDATPLLATTESAGEQLDSASSLNRADNEAVTPEAELEPSMLAGGRAVGARLRAEADAKSPELQVAQADAAIADASDGLGRSKTDSPVVLPSAKSLGLPSVEALAMDDNRSRRSGRRLNASRTVEKERKLQSLENAVSSPRLSQAMERVRSMEAESDGLGLAPAMKQAKMDSELLSFQLEPMPLARGSADALFRPKVESNAEADQGFDKEIRALNKRLFGSAATNGGGMGGGSANAGQAQANRVVDNRFQKAADHPASSFSIQTPSMSYRSLRGTLMRSAAAPVSGTVRIEEMLNYFPYSYATPKPNAIHPFAAALALSDCPWNAGNLLARVAVQGEGFDAAKRRPCNLVFMIDTSGSMDAPNKTPVFAWAFQSLAQQLKNQDRVAVVAFADASGVVLNSTSAKNKDRIAKSMANLSKGGSTKHGKGFALAAHIATENLIDGGVNRIIVCTDGDLGNARLAEGRVSDALESGVSVTVVGFSESKLAAAKRRLGALSREVDFLLIDSRADAKKQLATQLLPQPQAIATVSLQVEFNPDQVEQYRLIGWENPCTDKGTKQGEADPFLQGQSVTALYEIVPTEIASGKANWLTAILNYTRPGEEGPGKMRLGKMRLGEADSQSVAFELTQKPGEFDAMDNDFRFAAAVAGLGMTLRGSSHVGDWTVKDIQSVVKQSLGSDPYGVRAEFLKLSETVGQYVPNAGK